jgi:hypothetical protein
MITEQDIAAAEKLTPDPNDAHGVGFLIPEQTTDPYPNGYWKSFTTSGRACGLGFYCHKCHLLIVRQAPDTIWHCGGVSAFNPNAEIQVHKLGSFVRYPTQNEKWQAAMAVVEGEIETVRQENEAERMRRNDMLTPEPTLWQKLVTFLRSFGRN